MSDGRTHWEGCHTEHLDCALARLAECERERDDLRARLGTAVHQLNYWERQFARSESERNGFEAELAALREKAQRVSDAWENTGPDQDMHMAGAIEDLMRDALGR